MTSIVAELAGIELLIDDESSELFLLNIIEPQTGQFMELVIMLAPQYSHFFRRDCRNRQPIHPTPVSKIGSANAANIKPPAMSRKILPAAVGSRKIIIRQIHSNVEDLFISILIKSDLIYLTLVYYVFLV